MIRSKKNNDPNARLITLERVLVALSVLVLLLTVFFPVSGDLSIYALSGKTIAESKAIYYDYIDLKPPLFCMLYAIIYKTIGISQIALRGFDFFYQLLTIASLYYFVKKTYNDRITASVSILVYSALYCTLNFTHTMMPEGFAGLPLILISYFYIYKKNSIFNNLIIGVLAGYVINIKYSFAIFMLALLVYDINKYKWKELLIKYTYIIVAIILITLLSLIPLLNNNSYSGFMKVIDYLNYYSSIQTINVELFKYGLYRINIFYSEYLSLVFFISLVIGIYMVYDDKKHKGCNTERNASNIAMLMFMFLMLSIIIERKLLVYNFSRLYVFIAIFIAIGLQRSFYFIKNIWFNSTFKIKLLVVSMLCLSTAFTPIPRIIRISPIAYYFLFDERQYWQNYQREGDNTIQLENYRDIAKVIDENSQKNDLAVVVSIGGNLINYYFQNAAYSKFSQNQFYFSRQRIDDWYNDFVDEVHRSKWLVIQTNDYHPIITGNILSSYKSIEKDSALYQYFTSNFEYFSNYDSLYIYRRKM